MNGRQAISGQRETVKVLGGPDGGHRVIIFRRPDGLYGFGEQYLAKSDSAPSQWVLLWAEKTVCDTAETAEREARAAFPWLTAASDYSSN
jgi:hypothetical protein